MPIHVNVQFLDSAAPISHDPMHGKRIKHFIGQEKRRAWNQLRRVRYRP